MARYNRPLSAQGDVFQANLAGVVDAGDGKREPAALYLYLKGMRHDNSTTFRCCPLHSAQYQVWNEGLDEAGGDLCSQPHLPFLLLSFRQKLN
jgi:hypothetical protein